MKKYSSENLLFSCKMDVLQKSYKGFYKVALDNSFKYYIPT